MKVSRGCLWSLAFLPLACAVHSTQSHGLRRRAEEDILDAGIRSIRGICDPLVDECTTSNGMQVKEELTAMLGANSQVADVVSIEVGQLLCDSLDKVLESTLLRFAISSTQTVIAQRSYFNVMQGDPLTDNKERKVWIGDVIDPAPAAGSAASTISVTWTDTCDAEGFLLKMITRQNDGSTNVLTSMPCDAGTSEDICLVETKAVFNRNRPASTRKGKSDTSSRVLKANGDVDATQDTRKLQTKTEIDVLVFYTPEAMSKVGITSSSAIETFILSFVAEANLGNDNSEVLLQFNAIHVAELPYEQEVTSDATLTTMEHNAAVSTIRNGLGADLVHLIGAFEDYCGLANFFNDDADVYGITDVFCLNDLTLGHELGHNLGCDHNREVIDDNEEDHPFAYGFRYCTGADRYITIMSYDDNCFEPYANYYSNPDVMHLGKPTGTETENCARRIRETMDTVAAFRQTGGGGCVSTGDACLSTADCCDSNCADGVCGSCIYPRYRGDGECDAGLNTLDCGWDDGDCCECSNWNAPNTDGLTFNCLEPDPQCLDNCAFTFDYINDDFCDPETNTEECRWDGGDCCQSTCDADLSMNCNPPDGPFNCLEVCDPLTSVCPDGMICCPEKQVCEVPAEGTDPSACGDPHMTGFLGQKFDFTGEDGEWYCLISDLPDLHMNMRVTSPLPEVPIITYITGLAILTSDNDGLEHSIVITVKDPHSLNSSCPVGGVHPCLADGSLNVVLDGEEALLGPGSVALGEYVVVSAVNLPGPCRSFGFEQYWERTQLESALHGRRLQSKQQSMGDWILGDPTATNREECIEYIIHAAGEAGGVFAHQSEHATFHIETPKATIRLTHGRLHQVAMRDPTDQIDLPDHVTWQMNMGIDDNDVSRAARGILGETFVPTKNVNGDNIMFGMESIRGCQEDSPPTAIVNFAGGPTLPRGGTWFWRRQLAAIVLLLRALNVC